MTLVHKNFFIPQQIKEKQKYGSTSLYLTIPNISKPQQMLSWLKCYKSYRSTLAHTGLTGIQNQSDIPEIIFMAVEGTVMADHVGA